MQNKKYYINQSATFFDDEIDRVNNWKTIVLNSATRNFLEINHSGYEILRTIDQNPGIEEVELIFRIKKTKNVIKKFLKKMISENIIQAK